MSTVESAWGKHPDYRIEVVPLGTRARVWYGDRLLAESDAAMLLEEVAHVDRLYFPEAHVRWEHFERTQHHSVCPFKGEAEYWTLLPGAEGEEAIENLVWAYRTPFDEVGGIEGHVAFYQEKVRIEIEEQHRPDDPRSTVVYRFPLWGDASDLTRLLDIEPVDGTRSPLAWFRSPPFPSPRNVVEGGHMLAQSVVAASKVVPNQRVTSASMIFSKAAEFEIPLDLSIEVLRGGRTFSTVEARVVQDDKLRSVGILLLDSGAPDLFHGSVAMPDVAGPDDSEPHDMSVTGRDIRVVGGMYTGDPDVVGPPEIHTWVRFRDDPGPQHLHAALMAQSTTHWTIAAAMLPHPGFGQDQAHVTLSTGIMAANIAFHDEVDVTGWLLYSNPAVYAGRGLVQGEGHVFTEDGRLVATYSVQAIVRAFDRDPAERGLDYTNAM